MNDRFRFYIRLVDIGSFTKAAEDLHVSQPALSIAIQKLEQELQVKLLIRGSRSFKLTEAGELTYEAAKAMHVETNNLKSKLAVLAHQKVAVSLGMIDSAAEALFVNGDGFDELEKHAKISLSVNNSTHLIEALTRDEIDMALVTEQASLRMSSLEAIRVGKEPLVIVTHPGLLAVVQQGVRKGKLSEFLSYSQNSTSYKLVREVLAKRAVAITPSFYSTSPEILLRVVLSKHGTTVLPYLMVKKYLKSGKLSAVKIGGSCLIERPLSVIKHKNRSLISPLALLVRRITTIHKRLMKEALQLD